MRSHQSSGLSWQAQVRPVLEDTRAAQGVPGFVVAVQQGRQAPNYLVMGTDGAGQALTVDTLFPVASITKLATTLTVLRLVATRALDLDSPLAVVLPDAVAAREPITPRLLLCHIAGLPVDLLPGSAPYAPQLDWPALARACLATAPIQPPRTQVLYGNIGMGLLAIAVERLSGRTFSAAMTDLVLKPLGIEGYLGVEPPRRPAAVVGDFGEHAGTSLEPINSAFWRSLALPWAGLVTTAEGALKLVNAFAGQPSEFLPTSLRAEATRDQTGGLSGAIFDLMRWPRCAWGLGVELRGDKSPHWTPASASPASYGHVGATGVLAWSDPTVEVTWVIMGPRSFWAWAQRWPAIGAAILDAVR